MAYQVKFTVTDEAAAYLRWYARNIIFEKTPDLAARHLMMSRLEEIRRQGRKDEPSPEDLTPAAGGSEETDHQTD